MKQETCPIKLLSNYWSLQIVNALRDGGLRFCELQRTLDNLNPVTLTDRLKKLEEIEIIARETNDENKNCVTYSLTKKGKKAIPIFDAIAAFTQ